MPAELSQRILFSRSMKEYISPQRRRPTRFHRRSAAWWMDSKRLVAIALGSLLLGILAWRALSVDVPPAVPSSAVPDTAASTTVEKGFLFYDLLREPLRLPPRQDNTAPLPTTSAPEPNPTPINKAVPAGQHFVQLGAFRQRDQAEAAALQWRLKLLDAHVEPADVQGSTSYRVRVNVADAASAQALHQQLQSQGQASMIGHGD